MRARKTVVAAAALAVLVGGFASSGRAEPTQADGAIATEVEHRLSADREVNAQTITIDVRGGIVTLRGRVPSDEAKRRARTAAAGVPGVVEVRDEVTVAPSAMPGDAPGPIPEQMPGAQ